MTMPLVADYLDRLDAAADRLPPDQRAELVEGIREHLDSALAGVDPADEAQVRAALDRLGAPEEIVAAAVEVEPRRSQTTQPRRPGLGVGEVFAVILLPIGAFILPILGWFIGVVLLWVSDRWTTRDKLIGTFVWPGGYLLPGAFGLFAAQVCTTVPRSGGTGTEDCSGWAMPPWLGIPVSVALFLAPIVVVGYLITRARRSPAGEP